MSALCLYALLDAPPAGELGAGLAGEPLAVLPVAGLAVVAGEMTGRPAPSAAALAAYDAVIRRLAASAPALLPFRFGQAVDGPAALAAALLPRAAELQAALARVAGCCQMTLRIFAGTDAEPSGEPASGEPEPSPAAVGPGTRYLEARRSAERSVLTLPGVAELRAALQPLIREERLEPRVDAIRLEPRVHAARLEPGHPGRLLLSVHDLVPAAAAEEYRARVEAARLAMTSGARVAVSGPWPPYAFGAAAVPSLSAPASPR